VLCKIPQNLSGQLLYAIPKTVNILRELSSKEPYMGSDTTLGKLEELKWTTPKVLPNDTINLQNLGLLRFGLNEKEAEVYLAFLKKGENGDTIGNVNKELLDLKRTHIYRIIERLEKHGWVSHVIESDRKPQKYRAISLNHIIDDVEKDCGLLIFEYESPVDNHIVIRAALQLSFEKIRAKLFIYEDIDDDIKRGYKNPDLEDIKIIDKKILDYYGAEVYIRFEKGSKTANNVGDDWVMAVWGSEEKFTILLNMILKIS